MAEILIHNSKIFVSYKWLLENPYYEVSKKTIESWRQRNVGERVYKHNKAFISLESIPNGTKSKLPSQKQLIALLREGVKSNTSNEYLQTLTQAKEKSFTKFIAPISQKCQIRHDLILLFAQRAAILETLINTDTSKKGSLEALTKALHEIFPNWITTKHALKNLIKKAELRGCISVAIDERKIGNSNAAKFDYQVKHKAAFYYSSGKAYTAVQVREFLAYDCEVNGWPLPSIRTLRNWCLEFQKNIELHASRYGAKKTFDKVEPYISTIPALYADDQWQADGLDLPFYGKGYERLTLFFVLDAHSRKIIGFSIDKSENTLMILRAFDDAVKCANSLPFEIKMDNHSYNRTIEGQNFKRDTEAYGVKWTVSHNPRHKSLIERLNKTLNEKYFKKERGYIGEGIKSRNKDAHTAPELLDKYQKAGYWLTQDEIISIAVKVVDAYNNTPLKGGKTPNEIYAESCKPHAIQVNFEGRIKLFTKQTERKVSRGQITIERAGLRYEYQLPAELFSTYNGETVVVHYEDLESIYLFDKKNGLHITTLSQKPKVHGALANQTEKDKEILFKHKGKLTGIRTQANKDNKNKTEKMSVANPDALGVLNPITTPKDVLKEVQQQYQLKRKAEDLGIDFTRAEKSLPVDEFPLPSMKPENKMVKNPFALKNHKPVVRRTDDYNH